jgi:hypothetical protein
MTRIARERNPDISFEVGNMLDLDPAPNSFGGAVAFYSLINLVREDVPLLLSNLARGLAPGAPVAIASHCGKGELHEEELLGEKIEMVATLFTAEEIATYVREAGLNLDYLDTRSPLPDEYPTLRVYALASAPTARP